MVSACSCGTLTNVLPHRNVMPQTENMIPPNRSIQRQGQPDMLYIDVKCYFGQTQLYDAFRLVVSQKLSRSIVSTILNPVPVVCKSITLSAHPQLLQAFVSMREIETSKRKYSR